MDQAQVNILMRCIDTLDHSLCAGLPLMPPHEFRESWELRNAIARSIEQPERYPVMDEVEFRCYFADSVITETLRWLESNLSALRQDDQLTEEQNQFLNRREKALSSYLSVAGRTGGVKLDEIVEEAKEQAPGNFDAAIGLFRKWIDTDPALAEQVYGQDLEELFNIPESE